MELCLTAYVFIATHVSFETAAGIIIGHHLAILRLQISTVTHQTADKNKYMWY